MTQAPAAGTLPALPSPIPTLPGLPPIVPPVLPQVPDPTALIPAPLAANIQQFFFGGQQGAGVAAPPCRQQGPFTVQGERTQFPRVKPSANGVRSVGP
jgi:phospholipid/cholesterol/gamma-HCH transport system substrate-binding protein